MAYVTVPKDLTKVKSKVIFGLTNRQLICFSAAAAIGLPRFFLLKDVSGTTTAVIIRQMVEVKFIRPKERPYQTNNFYDALIRQNKLDKEVQAIVKRSNKTRKA